MSPVPNPVLVPGDVEVWTPPQAWPGQPLPLLLAHDGLEMVTRAGFLGYVAWCIERGALPPIRLGLLPPGPARDERYSANPAYARQLTETVIPALLADYPTRGRPVLMGPSLGGLAALHAGWTAPGLFDGLFLQSGSFFIPELDPQESGFAFWREITTFVDSVLSADAIGPLPAMTFVCGTEEENYANNLLMATSLAGAGVAVRWGEVPHGHTWMGWSAGLEPYLTELLQNLWCGR